MPASGATGQTGFRHHPSQWLVGVLGGPLRIPDPRHVTGFASGGHWVIVANGRASRALNLRTTRGNQARYNKGYRVSPPRPWGSRNLWSTSSRCGGLCWAGSLGDSWPFWGHFCSCRCWVLGRNTRARLWRPGNWWNLRSTSLYHRRLCWVGPFVGSMPLLCYFGRPWLFHPTRD